MIAFILVLALVIALCIALQMSFNSQPAKELNELEKATRYVQQHRHMWESTITTYHNPWWNHPTSTTGCGTWWNHPTSTTLPPLLLEELEMALAGALSIEDYESAADIRDRIKQLKSA